MLQEKVVQAELSTPLRRTPLQRLLLLLQLPLSLFSVTRSHFAVAGHFKCILRVFSGKPNPIPVSIPRHFDRQRERE